VFTLPTSGPTGDFAGHGKTMTVTTDEKGLATARGLKVNDVVGKLPIHVTASYRGQLARATITEFNMAPEGKHGGGSKKMLTILLLVGAGGAGAALIATHASGGTPGTPGGGGSGGAVIVLTPGSSTVGGPH